MNREGYQQRGLYDPAFEHDACGIGAVVDIKGRQSYETVDSALKIVEKLEPVSYTHLIYRVHPHGHHRPDLCRHLRFYLLL